MKIIGWIKQKIEEKRKRRNKEMFLLDEQSVNIWLEAYQANMTKRSQERGDNHAE